MAGTGEYEKFKGEGVFNCGACGAPLYKSSSKFDSGCGWPAFAEGYAPSSFVMLMEVFLALLNVSRIPRGA